MDYDIRLISTLDKVFPKSGMLEAAQIRRISAFRGQRVSFQAAYCYHGKYFVDQTEIQATRNPYVTVSVEGNFEGEVQIRKVKCVPVKFPRERGTVQYDSEYLCDEPGLYPDILEIFDGGIQIIKEQWRALWIDCQIPKEAKGGDRKITLIFTDTDGKVCAKESLILHVIPAELPKQRVIHTEWFHSDCLADYYHVDVFSEEYWRIVENFLRKARERGVNMILTPIFTLPLDTLIGGERTTTQLVAVTKKKGEYFFDYAKFHRWIVLCKKIGFDYFEVSHLFSQWGAKFPPKIVADVDGKQEKIFGWHTPVENGEYEKFLAAFLPTFVEELKKEKIADRTFFHISDEPTSHNIDTYEKAKDMVLPYIEGIPVLDALSDLAFYEKGVVEKPIPSSDHVHEFLDVGMKNGWTYYCVGQGYKVSNRFIAMPGWRTRILGVQLYKYQMEGFLHWGFNFYNTQYSLRSVNPYQENDADDAFPAGDAFIVYPGENGEAVESMRLPLMEDAMLDVRLLEYLEELTDRETVMKLVEQNESFELRFDEYPRGAEYLLNLWEKVAEEIEKQL